MKRFIIIFCIIFIVTNIVFAKIYIKTSSDYKALAESTMEKIISDGFGNLYTTYRIKYQGAYQIWVFNSFDKGRTWLPIGNEPIYSFYYGYDQKYATLGIDKVGRIYAVWFGVDEDNLGIYYDDGEAKYGEYQIKVSTYWHGKWSDWKNISQIKGYDKWIKTSVGEYYHYWQENPSIAFDSDNNAYVVWEGEDEDFPNSQIKFSKSLDGGNSWSTPMNITHISNNPTNNSINFVQKRPIILIDNNDKIYVLWEAQNEAHISSSSGSPYSYLSCIYSTNGGKSWFPDGGEAITSDNTSQKYMSAYLDKSDGKIHLVWSGKDKLNTPYKTAVKYQIRYGYYDGSWNVEPGYVAWIYGWEQKNPTITMDENKTLHILWEGNDDTYEYYDEGDPDTEDKKTGHYIFYSYRTNGGNWTQYKMVDKGLYPHYLKNSYNSSLSWVYLKPEGKDDFKLYFDTNDEILLNRTISQPDIRTNSFALHFAPIPFIPGVNNSIIKYEINNRSYIKIGIINLIGEEVAVLTDGIKEKGIHSFYWDGGLGDFNAVDNEIIGNNDKIKPGIYVLYIKNNENIKYKKVFIYK